MKKLGLDLGTKHIVLAWRDGEQIKHRYEVNGYFILPRADNFTEQLLIRNSIPYVTRQANNKSEFIAIGQKAEQLAYSFNKTLSRPMAEGGVSRNDDDAQEVIAIIIKSIIGKLTEDATMYYCTTAKPINNDLLNIDFHKKIVKLIIESYQGEAKLMAHHINEARCLVIDQLGQAIGISWGAGTVTVHAGIFGVPIFEFSVSGSGDWIDTEVAKRFGYNPEHPDRNSIETPTTVCRRKEAIDLTKVPDDKVGQAIYLMYEILIENVVKEICRGFRENKDKCRFDQPTPIVMAGGTCMPNGFLKLFLKKLAEVKDDLVIPVGDVKIADNTLFAVSHGCLLASEMHKEE